MSVATLTTTWHGLARSDALASVVDTLAEGGELPHELRGPVAELIAAAVQRQPVDREVREVRRVARLLRDGADHDRVLFG